MFVFFLALQINILSEFDFFILHINVLIFGFVFVDGGLFFKLSGFVFNFLIFLIKSFFKLIKKYFSKN